jgi:hypothetical protein
MSLRIQVLWDVMLCHFQEWFPKFGGTHCLHLQGSNNPRRINNMGDIHKHSGSGWWMDRKDVEPIMANVEGA